jgi:nitroreductase
MDFFQVVEKRRSVRKYSAEEVPPQVIERALQAAVLAPNSSNTQTWDFYWVRTPEKKQKLVEACLSQSAAREAKELIVVTANPRLWRRSQGPLVNYVRSVKAPKPVIFYYEKLVPFMYMGGLFNIFAPFKWLIANITGLFRPMPRGPNTNRGAAEVAIKSAALACENFVLAISAQGYDTCMMEGFDECRVRKLLKLSCGQRVVMVISVGRGAERGTWGPRFRLPIAEVVHEV